MKLEKGIPLPPKGHIKRSRYADVVEAWEVGNSVLLQTEGEAEGLRSAATSRGQKIAKRKTGEGWRIWRVA